MSSREKFRASFRRYGLVLMISLLVVIMTAGCWDRRELELLAFVLAVGFDRDPASGDYKIVAQIYNPIAMSQEGGSGGGGGDKKPAWVVEATGKTPFHARKNLAPMVSRELFWAYTSIVLLSEDLARDGIGPIMDFLERERQFRLIARPLVVDGDIKQVLTSDYPLEETIGQALLRQIETGALMRSISPVSEMRELINVISQPGHEMLIARLKGLEKEDEGKEGGGEKETQLDAPPPTSLSGGAVFRGDRMVGWVNSREARAWHWINSEVRHETLVVSSPLDEEPISVEVFRARSDIKPEVKGGKVIMKVKVQIQSRVQDQVSRADFVLDQDALSSLEKRVATVIKNDIKLAVQRAQDLGSDFLGFGNAIYRSQPKEWERLESKWPEVFPQLELDLDVRAKVVLPGSIKTPASIK
ncbi:MAG: Ger(x)C family spore germination protein, partial [bacterium]